MSAGQLIWPCGLAQLVPSRQRLCQLDSCRHNQAWSAPHRLRTCLPMQCHGGAKAVYLVVSCDGPVVMPVTAAPLHFSSWQQRLRPCAALYTLSSTFPIIIQSGQPLGGTSRTLTGPEGAKGPTDGVGRRRGGTQPGENGPNRSNPKQHTSE